MSTAVTLLGNVAADLPLSDFGMMVSDVNASQQIIDAMHATLHSSLLWRDGIFTPADC